MQHRGGESCHVTASLIANFLLTAASGNPSKNLADLKRIAWASRCGELAILQIVEMVKTHVRLHGNHPLVLSVVCVLDLT